MEFISQGKTTVLPGLLDETFHSELKSRSSIEQVIDRFWSGFCSLVLVKALGTKLLPDPVSGLFSIRNAWRFSNAYVKFWRTKFWWICFNVYKCMACTWSTQKLAGIFSHSQLLLKSRTFLSRLVFTTDWFLYKCTVPGCQIIRLY